MIPRVLVSHRTFCDRHWQWHNPVGFNPCLNLWLIVSGRGTWRTGERTFHLAPGDLFVQRLWEECHGTNGHAEPLEVLWANFTYDAADASALDQRTLGERLPTLHRRCTDLGFSAGLAGRMVAARSGPIADRWLACTLDEAARDARLGNAADTIDAGIETIVAEVRRDPARAWRVAGLARRVGMGVDPFTRRFKASTGLSPREFLVEARLDAAKAALRMTADPIGAIAERLGYCDIYHFSRRFRRHVGQSPSAYRAGSVSA